MSRHEAFRSNLSDDDFKALSAAEAAERGAADLLLRFYEAYDNAAAVAAAYDKVSDVRVADSLHAAFERAVILEKGAARQLNSTWEQIFDHKTFAYNYLLEVLGKYDVLEQMQHRTTEAMSRIADGREGVESGDVLRYFVQKELIFSYEHTIGELLGAPLDSLNEAQHVFELLHKPLPPLSLAERSFITYEAVRVASPARYNAAKPIPAVQVYRQGLVYRVRVGNYPARQAVSAFRGMYPLGYAQSGTRWDYFAGGYADLAGAEKGLAEVKKRGFSGAVLAMWNNGVYTFLGTGAFNVEIDAKELSTDALSAAKASGRDLTRVGDRFVLGRFDNGLDAERAAAAIRTADPSLTVTTVSD